MRPASVIRLAIAAAALVCAQDDFDPYSIGVALMQPVGCPVFISEVMPGSPAARAGLKPGDRIRSIDHHKIESNSEAAQLLRSWSPDKVKVKISRGREEYEAEIPRERISDILAQNGRKIVSGVVVPHSLSGTWISERLFANGYPLDGSLYYPGFEVLVVPDEGRRTLDGLVLRGTLQIVVGDVEPGGPAAAAGVKSGDIILSVNGVAPAGRSGNELARLFASRQPETMQLEIKRDDETHTVEFALERAADVARGSGKVFVNAMAVPAWLIDHSASCRAR